MSNETAFRVVIPFKRFILFLLHKIRTRRCKSFTKSAVLVNRYRTIFESNPQRPLLKNGRCKSLFEMDLRIGCETT